MALPKTELCSQAQPVSAALAGPMRWGEAGRAGFAPWSSHVVAFSSKPRAPFCLATGPGGREGAGKASGRGLRPGAWCSGHPCPPRPAPGHSLLPLLPLRVPLLHNLPECQPGGPSSPSGRSLALTTLSTWPWLPLSPSPQPAKPCSSFSPRFRVTSSVSLGSGVRACQVGCLLGPWAMEERGPSPMPCRAQTPRKGQLGEGWGGDRFPRQLGMAAGWRTPALDPRGGRACA